MLIKSIYLENFRGYREKTVVDFNNMTCLIGKNDIGKSTILEAMDIFFNDGKNIVKSDAMDLNIGSDSDEFYIGVIFKDFPKDFIVDSTVATTLEDEYLLNKDGFLEIKKVYKKGKNTDTYLVANYPTNSILETIHLDTNKELKEKVNKYKLSVEDKRKSSLLRKALIKEFDTLELKSKELPIDKEGTKQIWKNIERYFPLFELFQSDRKNLDQDNEIQNPMKLLIKEIIKKENIDEKLNEIFNEIKVKTEELTELTVKKLSEMNPEISKSLETNFSAPRWESVFKFSLDTEEGVPLNKRGSGVRRLILLNFFRAEAERRQNERNVPSIIYAFEEPETSQHPHFQKMLIQAFKEILIDNNSQILITTHSPSIASMLNLEDIRYIYKDDNNVLKIEKTNTDHNILNKIAKSLGIFPNIQTNEIHKVKCVVCVEGKNDIIFLKGINKSINEYNSLIDLSSESILLIPMGGSSLQYWVNEDYLGKLNLPQFHIYDSDIGSRKEHKYEKCINILSKKERCIAIETKLREFENYIPKKVIRRKYEGIQINNNENWDTLDVAEFISKHVYNSSENRGSENWDMLQEDKKKKKISKIKNQLNQITSEVEVEDLIEHKVYDEILNWHKAIKELIK